MNLIECLGILDGTAVFTPEGISVERGTAPWFEDNLEHKYNKARIKELKF